MKKLVLIIISALFFAPAFIWGQGCMEPSADEGVQVIGYIQPQYEYDFLSDDLTGESMNESSFYFNRARLGVMGSIPYDFSYYVVFEFSPNLNGVRDGQAPLLLDGFLSYNRFAPYAKVAVGQFKSPFGLEALTACHKLHTINRSDIVMNAQGLFRDMGVMVSGGTGELSLFGSKTTNLFGYHFALMNGTGINNWDDNNQKDIVARLTFHPVEFLTLGASYRQGERVPQDPTAEENDERKRLGFDAEINFKNLLLQGEYLRAEDIGSYTVGGGCGGPGETIVGTKKRDGYFVQAVYTTPWNIQPVIRYQTYDPNMDMAVGDPEFDMNSDFVQNTITYGVNYFFNEWTRLQVNYQYRAEETGDVEYDNDVLLVQMQVVF